jgi:hypothetical protein
MEELRSGDSEISRAQRVTKLTKGYKNSVAVWLKTASFYYAFGEGQ